MTEHLQIYCDSKTSLNIFLTVSTPKKAVGTVKIMNTKKLSAGADLRGGKREFLKLGGDFGGEFSFRGEVKKIFRALRSLFYHIFITFGKLTFPP